MKKGCEPLSGCRGLWGKLKMKARRQNRRQWIEEAIRKEVACAQVLKVARVAANEASSMTAAIQLCLRGICDCTHWPVGHAHLLAQSDVRRGRAPVDIWHVALSAQSESLQKAIDANRLRGLGLWSSLEIPVQVGEEILAVCEFFSSESIQEDILWVEVMASVGAAVGRIIERSRSEEALRSMTGNLLNLQDDERRRLAAELHDTTAQKISLITMDLDLVGMEIGELKPSAHAKLSECAALARQSLQEIRTFSYLLHPPMLDELGVIPALRIFVEGFSERSGLHVDLELPEHSIRMPRDLETAIFRVVQESLTNVHKHSQSPTATIRVRFEASTVTILVEDEGTGLSRPSEGGPLLAKMGVGIGSMRERVKQCGGQIAISSRAKGTVIEVSLPVPEAAKAAMA
jgi:signal transduction histidine kinase